MRWRRRGGRLCACLEANRVHIDINAVDMDAEVRRLTALGARVLRRLDQTTGPYHELWTIMSDPEGNEFCVQHAPPRAE